MSQTIRESQTKGETDHSTQAVPSSPPNEDPEIIHPSEKTGKKESHSHVFDDKNAFTKKEKWLIVAMIGFAGFFRCVLK